METMHITIKNEKVYQQVLKYLKKFDRDDLQFIEEKQVIKIREDLLNELNSINEGTSDLVDLEDYNRELEERLSGYENKDF